MTGTLILGAGGQLGRELSILLPDSTKYFHSGSGGFKFDLRNFGELEKIVLKMEPDVILNASALANVDLCEKEKKLAFDINAYSLKTLSQAARRCGSLLVHVSTDYVFDGSDGNYGEGSVPNPINYYGMSKLLGDTYVDSYENSIIVRTSGVYGYNNNFPLFVLNKLRKGDPITAIKGFYSPIHAQNLARSIVSIAESSFRGLVNVAGVKVSRFELAVAIAEKFNLNSSLVAENVDLASLNAKRPYDSSLNITLARSMLKSDFYSIDSNLSAFAEKLGHSD